MMKRRTLLIIFFVGCNIILYPLRGIAMAIKPNSIEKIKDDYKQINFSDGISEKEAAIIAKHYIATNEDYDLVSNVKMNSVRVEKSGFDDTWWAVSFDANFKFKRKTGLKWYTIHIDKSSGELKTRGWGPA